MKGWEMRGSGVHDVKLTKVSIEVFKNDLIPCSLDGFTDRTVWVLNESKRKKILRNKA